MAGFIRRGDPSWTCLLTVSAKLISASSSHMQSFNLIWEKTKITPILKAVVQCYCDYFLFFIFLIADSPIFWEWGFFFLFVLSFSLAICHNTGTVSHWWRLKINVVHRVANQVSIFSPGVQLSCIELNDGKGDDSPQRAGLKLEISHPWNKKGG